MRRPLALAAFAFTLLLTGCSGIVGEGGSGDLVTETREVGEFTAIDVSRAIRVEVTVAAGEPSVEVIYDDNLIDGIEVSVDGGVLVLDADRNMRPSDGAKIVVRVAALDEITASGASSVIVAGSLEGDAVRLKVSGASRIEAPDVRTTLLDIAASGASTVTLRDGDVADADLSVSGASRVDLDGVVIAKAVVDVSGASRAEVRGAVEVRGDASGASRVTVSKDATRVLVETSGASSIDVD
ncbi:MAG: hypothetical protein AMXMBFR23_13490 [Chloroflexota bacterium]